MAIAHLNDGTSEGARLDDDAKDIKIETQPGAIPDHRNIPVQSAGRCVPRGKFPMVALAHMSVRTESVAGSLRTDHQRCVARASAR